jgi:hypothetical protein
MILVHGAWADASSWTGVIQRLQAAGHDVVALPNTLRGPKADAAVMVSHPDVVVEVIETALREVGELQPP